MHPADPVCGNLLGTDRIAFEVASPAAEALGLYLALHGVGATGPFRLPLRQLPQVRQLKLRSRKILVLQNPEAADVFADVNPAH